MASAQKIIKQQRCKCVSFGKEPLLIHSDGRILDLATGYIPLLSSFTTEDKAAKGLRKGKETSSQPEYFSLLQLVHDNQILLLSGPVGSGKTTFAKHLCWSVVDHNRAGQNATAVAESTVAYEQWDTSGLQPFYFAIKDAQDLKALAHDTIPTLLASLPESDQAGLVIAIDIIENADDRAAEDIDAIATQILASPNERNRLVFLGDSKVSGNWVIPPTVARHSIKPLSATRRQQMILQLTQAEVKTVHFALGDAAANPALFALALQAKHHGDEPEVLLDAWLATVASTEEVAGRIGEDAFLQTCREIRYVPAVGTTPRRGSSSLVTSRKVRNLLAARHLSTLSVDVTVEFFQQNPVAASDVIQSLLTRLASSSKFDDLARALLRTEGTTSQRAALLLAKSGQLPVQLEGEIRHQALTILEEGRLPIAERQDAASILSSSGDTRDLAALVDIPAGMIVLGSNTHPNSQPTHELFLDAFRIGVFPVTVHQYDTFSTTTDRQWISPDSQDPSKQNFPATDVTWHDAVAYCEWLTTHWRADGKISADELVRLPSEPEWEKAASGGQNQHDLSHCVYPWGTDWHSNAFNSEQTGLNQPCAVGLFPKGRSPYGCHDMAGNIWEWCTTLWGEDMATPSFGYPWRDDGREAVDAPPEMRRVLRGGCFSSGRLKANCTYRGSLEPAGFWRGNGFRVVVAACR
jgi:iron(II)-dependent oxidoreductase